MSENRIRIGTRQSPLALCQTRIVQDLLEKSFPGVNLEIVPITTTGDATQKSNRHLATIGGKALFLKELEVHLKEDKIDIAVHSLKDVPAWVGPDFSFPCVLEREDPRDAFVSRKYDSINEIADDAIMGTCSTRRQSQFMKTNPNVIQTTFRGNVGKRLEKLDEGLADFTFLAYAGLKRLGLQEHATQVLDIDEMIPAIGQGAIVIETLSTNDSLRKMLSTLSHSSTKDHVNAERAFLATLGGSCTTPIGSYCRHENGTMALRGFVGTVNGKHTYEILEKALPNEDPIAFGFRCGQIVHNQIPPFVLSELGLLQSAPKSTEELKLNICGF